MQGHDALFPDFDQLTDAENALTERLSQARRNYASRKATSAELTPDWLEELQSKRFDQPEDLNSYLPLKLFFIILTHQNSYLQYLH